MKKIILFCTIVLFIHLAVFSQNRLSLQSDQSHTNKGYTEKIYFTGSMTELEARFSADITYGAKPLSVHFTDESLGNPVSWTWDFGDGGTSSEQHPTYSYVSEGKYSVRLTISDGSNTYTLEKENYITILQDQENCDTLTYPFVGSYTYYLVTGEGFGYVSGNNNYQDKAKANYLFSYPADSEIQGLLLEFAIAKHGSGTNPSITFAIWDNTGSEGSPGAVKASATIPLTQIVQDVSNETFTYVQFTNAVPINAPFYAGVILPTSVGDTIVLWTNTNGDVSPAIGWEQWSDNKWYPYSSTSGWGLSISNAIFPVVCPSSQDAESLLKPEDIRIFPNPATDQVTIRFSNPDPAPVRISIYNIMGGLMKTVENLPSQSATTTISLSGYPKGLYFIIIDAGHQKFTRKIHVV